jgi:hypothetical protein
MLLQGRTGCGKSSFLRAGLIPYLESSVGRFQFLHSYYNPTETKALFIRCTEAPLDRLCETLYDWAERPFLVELPDGEKEEIPLTPIRGEARTRADFVKFNAISVEKIIGALRLIGELLPRTIVLVIDQGEEVLTLNEPSGNLNSDTFLNFLIEFSKSSIDVKLVVALRKEYFGDFYDELNRRHYDRERIRDFLLRELPDDKLVEAIKMPTSQDVEAKYLQGREQPGKHYDFDFAPGVPELIVQDLKKIKTPGGVLPVLQITCERLYRKAKNRSDKSLLTFGERLQITRSEYVHMTGGKGGLDTQVRQYLDESIVEGIAHQLPDLKVPDLAEERDRWKDVLHYMVRKESDNTALSKICSGIELGIVADSNKCRAKFSDERTPDKGMASYLSSEDRRILRKDRRKPGIQSPFVIVAGQSPAANSAGLDREKKDQDFDYYSLGHDAIAVELDSWGATRTVLLHRRDYFGLIIQRLTQVFSVYLIAASLPVTFINYQSAQKLTENRLESFSIALLFFMIFFIIAAFLWIFSERIAREVVERLIRNPVFRNLLWEPPVQ